jgi:hypothetical protein
MLKINDNTKKLLTYTILYDKVQEHQKSAPCKTN